MAWLDRYLSPPEDDAPMMLYCAEECGFVCNEQEIGRDCCPNCGGDLEEMGMNAEEYAAEQQVDGYGY